MSRYNILWLILLALIFNSSEVASAATEEPGWELVAPGIEFQQYQLPDPNNVFVVRMYRNNPSVTLESSIAQGKISEGIETVSEMFARYDQAINFWGGNADPPNWGMRNQVVVAINGIYFDWESGIPQGGLVQSGWYAKRFDDFGGQSGFAWNLDRSIIMGECVHHRPEKQLITYSTANTQQFNGINRPREENELILYTPQYDDRTGTDDAGVEVLVEMGRPTMILPDPAYASGTVRQVRENLGDSLIPFNHIVLSAHGTAAETLLLNAQPGSEIRVSQEITACAGHEPISWTKTYASIQGGYYYLNNGLIVDYDDAGATNYHPRTAIAYNDQYVFFIVVDGRHRDHSVGMTIHDLALFTRDTLGAGWGVAEDGGGSSTMVINGDRINNTYCNEYGCLGGYTTTYLPVVTRNNQEGQAKQSSASEDIRIDRGYERAVANGMLMVSVQPEEYSATFTPGEAVTTITDIEIRLGPGTNYAGFSTIQAGTGGTIADQTNGMNGVLAKSTNWWYVDFGGVLGWVPEEAIENQAAGDGK